VVVTAAIALAASVAILMFATRTSAQAPAISGAALEVSHSRTGRLRPDLYFRFRPGAGLGWPPGARTGAPGAFSRRVAAAPHSPARSPAGGTTCQANSIFWGAGLATSDKEAEEKRSVTSGVIPTEATKSSTEKPSRSGHTMRAKPATY
jgi:hypothetical protein